MNRSSEALPQHPHIQGNTPHWGLLLYWGEILTQGGKGPHLQNTPSPPQETHTGLESAV